MHCLTCPGANFYLLFIQHRKWCKRILVEFCPQSHMNISFLSSFPLCSQKKTYRGGSRIFFRRGCTRLLLYFNTNKAHSFFLQNTGSIRKLQVISGWGGRGAHPPHPPPRSAPDLNVHVLSDILAYSFFYVRFRTCFLLIFRVLQIWQQQSIHTKLLSWSASSVIWLRNTLI